MVRLVLPAMTFLLCFCDPVRCNMTCNHIMRRVGSADNNLSGSYPDGAPPPPFLQYCDLAGNAISGRFASPGSLGTIVVLRAAARSYPFLLACLPSHTCWSCQVKFDCLQGCCQVLSSRHPASNCSNWCVSAQRHEAACLGVDRGNCIRQGYCSGSCWGAVQDSNAMTGTMPAMGNLTALSYLRYSRQCFPSTCCDSFTPS